MTMFLEATLHLLVPLVTLYAASLVEGAFDLGFHDDSDLTAFVTVRSLRTKSSRHVVIITNSFLL